MDRPAWWNSNEQQVHQSLSKNIGFQVKPPQQLFQEAKHLGLQLPHQESPSTQSCGQSHYKVVAMNGTNSSECGPAENCGKDVEGPIRPVLFSSNLNNAFDPSQADYSQAVARLPNPCVDPSVGALYSYGSRDIIQPPTGTQMVGIAPARVPLPLDLSEDGPIYVNAKQYHGILRRRQSRAKLEAQNKLIKSRKPYLHESRHLHAVNRVRGSGGRFLSTKKLQQPNPTDTSSSTRWASDSMHSHQKNDITGFGSLNSVGGNCVGPVTSCNDVTSVSNNNNNNATFQQPDSSFWNMSHMGGSVQCSGAQHCASIVR